MSLFFKKNYVRFIILLLIGFLPVIIYNSVFHSWNLLVGYANGFFIGGATLIAIGLLILLSNNGAYYIFSYMFARRKNPLTGVHEDYYTYTERKKAIDSKKELVFLPYFIVGGFYLSFGIIFTLCVH